MADSYNDQVAKIREEGIKHLESLGYEQIYDHLKTIYLQMMILGPDYRDLELSQQRIVSLYRIDDRLEDLGFK